VSHRLGEARLTHRLHEIVERVRFERAHRELVVRRDEDDRRHPDGAVGPQYLEAIELWHLDIEEDEVGREGV
jgi:hypothetical protein